MIYWIVVVAYLAMGTIVGKAARNRSMDKWFEFWHDAAKKAWDYKSEDEQKKIAFANANTYNSGDWQSAYVLGFAFWPVFIVYFLFDKVVTFIENHAVAILPKSQTEKMIEQLDKEANLKQMQVQLEIDRKKLTKLAKSMNLSTEGLQSFDKLK